MLLSTDILLNRGRGCTIQLSGKSKIAQCRLQILARMSGVDFGVSASGMNFLAYIKRDKFQYDLYSILLRNDTIPDKIHGSFFHY